MSASAGVRGSSSSSSSSSLKSLSNFRTTLALSVRCRLLSFDLLRAGESLLGGGFLLLFRSRSAFSCLSISMRHCLVCWVNSLANLLYALSLSLEALDGSSLPSATGSFTLAIDSLDKIIFSLGGPSATVAGACCLLLDGWLPFWLPGACPSGTFIGMDPGAPSFTTIWLVLPGPIALLVVGASWHVLESPACPLPPGVGASTSARSEERRVGKEGR